MTLGCFVSGTDTGVGKTLVTAALASTLTGHFKYKVGVFKPIESGVISSGVLDPASDAAVLRDAADCKLADDTICPIRFSAPLAPAVAARVEAHRVDLDRIDGSYRRLQQTSEIVLVEGCGGLLVPITEKLLVADLVVRLQLPLLIVARAGLGTINHTGLTIEAARSRGIPILGVVLSGADENREDPSQADNAAEIERCFDVRVWGAIPCIAAGSDTRTRLAWLQSNLPPTSIAKQLLDGLHHFDSTNAPSA